jgi:hypothetical protein
MMRWAGHLARRGEIKNAYKTLTENLNGRDHLETLGIDRMIILEWILGK